MAEWYSEINQGSEDLKPGFYSYIADISLLSSDLLSYGKKPDSRT